MTVRVYTASMLLGAIIYWALFIILLISLTPQQAGLLGFFFFYASLYGLSVGTIYIVGSFIQKRMFQKLVGVKNVRVATRHSVLFAILLLVSLWLQSHRLLTWLNVILLIALLTLIEFFLMSKKMSENDEG